jgi:hypothetical protein
LLFFFIQIFPDSNYFLFEQEFTNEADKIGNDHLERFSEDDDSDSDHQHRGGSKHEKRRRSASATRRLSRSIDQIELEKLKHDPSVKQIQ